MSNFTRFRAKLEPAQQRYLLDGTKKLPGYMKVGTVQSQASFPNVYSRTGLAADGNVFATWTTRTSATSTATVYSAGYTGSLFWYGANEIATSTDGITFNNASTSLNPVKDITYGAGIYVAVGSGKSSQFAYTSTNGSTWTARTVISGSTSTLNTVIYVGGSLGFLTAGGGGAYATSTDGITWTNRTGPAGLGTTSTINSLIYGNNIYLYATNNGGLATSTDALTWTARISGVAVDILSLAYGNNLYAYAGFTGNLRTSTDGITWNTRTSGTSSNINAIRYFTEMSLWWYVGDNGAAATSTDAITWTSRITGVNPGKNSNGLGYGINAALNASKNMIFAAGDNGILKSAIVTTYDISTSFLLPNTVNFTYTYLNTTPSTYVKKN